MMNRAIQIPFVQYGCHHLRNYKNGNFKLLCTRSKECNNKIEPTKGMTRDEAYRQLENLDFKTAAKILFTDPPKKKKFGLDFHLVQLFFACLPSLAVYFVAQYARSEMKRMDAELHQKRKQAEVEEEKKEEEKLAVQERTESELVEVKGRLDALEVTVKEIADQAKKIAQSIPSRDSSVGFRKPTGSSDIREAASSSEDGGKGHGVPRENSKSHNIGSQGHEHKGYPQNGPSDLSDDAKHQGLREVARRWAGYFRDR